MERKTLANRVTITVLGGALGFGLLAAAAPAEAAPNFRNYGYHSRLSDFDRYGVPDVRDRDIDNNGVVNARDRNDYTPIRRWNGNGRTNGNRLQLGARQGQ